MNTTKTTEDDKKKEEEEDYYDYDTMTVKLLVLFQLMMVGYEDARQ